MGEGEVDLNVGRGTFTVEYEYPDEIMRGRWLYCWGSKTEEEARVVIAKWLLTGTQYRYRIRNTKTGEIL